MRRKRWPRRHGNQRCPCYAGGSIVVFVRNGRRVIAQHVWNVPVEPVTLADWPTGRTIYSRAAVRRAIEHAPVVPWTAAQERAVADAQATGGSSEHADVVASTRPLTPKQRQALEEAAADTRPTMTLAEYAAARASRRR